MTGAKWFGQHCRFHSYEEDGNGDVVLMFCSHGANKSDREGNCNDTMCPLLQVKF